MRDTRRSSKEKRVRRGGEGVKEGREGKGRQGREERIGVSCLVRLLEMILIICLGILLLALLQGQKKFIVMKEKI